MYPSGRTTTVVPGEFTSTTSLTWTTYDSTTMTPTAFHDQVRTVGTNNLSDGEKLETSYLWTSWEGLTQGCLSMWRELTLTRSGSNRGFVTSGMTKTVLLRGGQDKERPAGTQVNFQVINFNWKDTFVRIMKLWPLKYLIRLMKIHDPDNDNNNICLLLY